MLVSGTNRRRVAQRGGRLLCGCRADAKRSEREVNLERGHRRVGEWLFCCSSLADPEGMRRPGYCRCNRTRCSRTLLPWPRGETQMAARTPIVFFCGAGQEGEVKGRDGGKRTERAGRRREPEARSTMISPATPQADRRRSGLVPREPRGQEEERRR